MGTSVGQEIKCISVLVLKTNIHPCAGCFSYTVSFKEIKVGFGQEDLSHKRKNAKQKSGMGWQKHGQVSRSKEKSGNRGCESQSRVAHRI